MIDFLKDVLGDRVRVNLHYPLEDDMKRKFIKEIKGSYNNVHVHVSVCTYNVHV